MRLAELDGVEAVFVRRELLFDDVRLDRDTQVVRLSGQVSRRVMIDPVFLERLVSQIAPEKRGHTQFMSGLERLGDFHQLAMRVLGAPVDRRAHRGSAHVERLLHIREAHLLVAVRIREQLVVVELDDERDLVGVLPGHGAQNAERRGHGVAAALDGQLDDVLRVEVDRVRREGSGPGMLDSLVHRQNR